MKKEEFKEFVKQNPVLLKYIRSNEMTWQKFYEMYDIYGSDNDIWDEYLKPKEEVINKKNIVSGLTINEVFNWFKNIDLDNLQEGIGNVQRVLGVVQDFTNKKDTGEVNTYKPRPLYKHFED